MQIKGKVKAVIYKNISNGYTVMLLKVDKQYITIVGDGTGIEVGDEVVVTGEYTKHKNYGEQFAFTSIEKELPSDSVSLIDYIANSKIKGVGQKTAEKIVKKFGDDALEVIRYHPDMLLDIKGMNEDKANFLSEYINNEWERWNLTNFLSKYEIGLKTAMKIYDELGVDAINIVKENPYTLMEFCHNLEFKVVDKLADGLGLEKDNENRIGAGVLHILNYFLREGNTCIEKEILEEYVGRLLEISENKIEDVLSMLELKNKIVLEKRFDDTYVYRQSIYTAEENVSKHLKNLTKKPSNKYELNKLIDEVANEHSIVLSCEQTEAINVCINNSLSVITGGPGTGKTTIIKCIIDILKRKNLSYVLAAPTGRAAKRITETTGEDAKTLHRMLEISKIEDEDFDARINYPVEVIDTDVVIVDEASMIDIILMNNLIKALKDTTKLILVGDADQLPSVGPGSVLKDIINSGIAHTIFLKEVYRQSLKSDIICSAHEIKKGEHITFKNKDTDMFFIPTDSMEDTIEEIKSLIDFRLKAKYDEGFLGDIQILSPIKKTMVGTYELNKVIQELKLKPQADMIYKSFGDKKFYEGDKVMQITNNYDREWDKNGTRGTGIYNGDIGFVTRINLAEGYLLIEFDDNRVCKYEFEDLEEIEHAYAITVHKSQGSEFNTVIIPLYVCFEKLFNRNLIYTAMTRAKNLLIFVGKKGVLNYMIDNVIEKKRITGLEYKLEK